jgi:hypothetical protein
MLKAIQKKDDGDRDDKIVSELQTQSQSNDKTMYLTIQDNAEPASPEIRATQFMKSLQSPSDEEKKKISARIARERAGGQRAAIRWEVPQYVCLPNEVIADLFEKNALIGDYTVFKTHTVLGDGNCMYHCLSDSSIFAKHAEHFASKHKELRTWISLFAEQEKIKNWPLKLGMESKEKEKVTSLKIGSK